MVNHYVPARTEGSERLKRVLLRLRKEQERQQRDSARSRGQLRPEPDAFGVLGERGTGERLRPTVRPPDRFEALGERGTGARIRAPVTPFGPMPQAPSDPFGLQRREREAAARGTTLFQERQPITGPQALGNIAAGAGRALGEVVEPFQKYVARLPAASLAEAGPMITGEEGPPRLETVERISATREEALSKFRREQGREPSLAERAEVVQEAFSLPSTKVRIPGTEVKIQVGVAGALELLPWLAIPGGGQSRTGLLALERAALLKAGAATGAQKLAYQTSANLLKAGAEAALPLAKVEEGVAQAFGVTVKAVKAAPSVVKRGAEETMVRTPIRPVQETGLRLAGARGVAGAAAPDFTSVKGLDTQIVEARKAIRFAERSKTPTKDLEDTLEFLQNSRRDVIEVNLGAERFARLTQAEQELFEAQAILKGLRESREVVPKFGTLERADFDAARMQRRQAGQRVVSKAQQVKEARATIQGLKTEISNTISDAATEVSSVTPVRPATQPQTGGVAQAGMGIGERPAPAQLFEGAIGDGGAVPLANREALAAAQARREAVAKGQQAMPEAAGGVGSTAARAPTAVPTAEGAAGGRAVGEGAGATRLIARVEGDKTLQGGLARGLDAYAGDIRALSDDELVEVLQWVRTQNPFIHRFFGGNLAGEFSQRGLRIPEAAGGVPTRGIVEPSPQRAAVSPAAQLQTPQRLRGQAGVGTGGNTQNMPAPQTVSTRVEAQQNIAREAFDAVPGSPVDDAATAYWRTGNFDDFIGRMGPPDDPFPLLPGFADDAFSEVGMVSAGWADPTRLVQAIDQGVFGRALQRAVLWPTRRTFLASLKFGDATKGQFHAILQRHNMLGLRAQKLRNLAGDVLEHIPRVDIDTSVSALLTRQPVRALLTGLSKSNRERVIAFAQDSRRFFDDVWTMQNKARVARGQDPIEYIENYRPWVRETNLWSRLGFADQPIKEIAQAPLMSDFIKPNAPFNPRAAARVGGLRDYEKIRDLQRLGMDYVDTASKDIFYTNIVQNAKVHIKQLRAKNLEEAASGVEDWIMEAYAGKMSAASLGTQKIVPPLVRSGMLKLRRNLTRAVFPLNWTWNMFVQTSSGALTIHRYGIVDTMRGLSYLAVPSVRSAVRENAYSSIIKARRGGKAALQDIGPGVEKTARIERTPIETVEDLTNLITSSIEDALTGVSVRAAYHSGKKQGLTGRALWEFASEGGSKTQSMYNLQDIPGVLRTREAGAIVPFQTFAFEVMNTVRELGIPGLGRIGMHQTTQNRLLSISRWVGAMVAFSAISDKAINRRPWQLSSFIPFWGLVTGGLNAGNPWNYALPLKYTADFKRGLDDYLRHGNWKRLRSWAIQYHMLAGTQINRTLLGIEAVADGKKTDAAGSTLFEVSPGEAWKVITQGPYASAEGQEYVDRLQERRGPFSEFTGIPFPEMQSSLERKWRAEIKEYNDIPSDPIERAQKLKNAKEKGDEAAIAKYQFSPTQYRQAYPEIDAKLFIADPRVTSLQTPTINGTKRYTSVTEALKLIKDNDIDPDSIKGIKDRKDYLARALAANIDVTPNAVDVLIYLLEKEGELSAGQAEASAEPTPTSDQAPTQGRSDRLNRIMERIEEAKRR